MTQSTSKEYLKYICYLIFLFVFIFALLHPIVKFPDSEGYLNMSIIRSAAYPIFLNLIETVFGSFFNTATKIIQVSLGLFAVHFFTKKIKTHIKIDEIWYILLTLILLIPYVYNHFLANRFLSEALSYPLYLIIVAQFIAIVSTKKVKDFIYVFPCLFILLLTRSQFLYLIPIAILIVLFITKKEVKQNFWVLIVLVSFPFIVSITDKMYHKLKHDYYVSTPWTGIHLISSALYVSDKDDINLFTSETERDFFEKSHQELSHKRLNINYLDPRSNADKAYPFISSYSKIANQTVLPIAEQVVNSSLSSNETFIAVDKLTRKMTIPLIRDNYKKWFTLYLKNMINAFGNSKMLLFYGILFIFGIISALRNPSNKNKVMILILLLVFSNIALVAIGINTIKRYVFYNDWVLFFILFILLHSLWNNKSAVRSYT